MLGGGAVFVVRCGIGGGGVGVVRVGMLSCLLVLVLVVVFVVP